MSQFSLNNDGHSADMGRVDLNSLLRSAVEHGASDVHIKFGQPPVIRHDGMLLPLEGYAPLTTARLAAFHDTGELDTAYQVSGLPRFRVNAFRQRGEISFAFRIIPKMVPSFESLGLPQGVHDLSEEHRGLVLVTGATGAGK